MTGRPPTRMIAVTLAYLVSCVVALGWGCWRHETWWLAIPVAGLVIVGSLGTLFIRDLIIHGWENDR